MDWSTIPGFGVAGNFTGHLEQAGESPDFVNVQTNESHAPKGIFPFYLPGISGSSQLQENPYSHDTIRLLNDTENHQIEPEVSILFNVTYEDAQVACLTPVQAMAHNDCSIRRHGAKKISEKKNWGANSKGVAATSIPLTNVDPSGTLDGYKLACYLIRDGITHTYGATSWVKDYSYFHNTLLDWCVDRFNNQQNHGPLEHLHAYLEEMNHPTQICISIGATRYTAFGESNFLQVGDIICVALYHAQQYSDDEIQQHLSSHRSEKLPNTSILTQVVTGPTS